jgi:hypothetical protein
MFFWLGIYKDFDYALVIPKFRKHFTGFFLSITKTRLFF